MTPSPSPYVPENPLLPVVGEHTFVQTIGAPGVSLEATELDRLTASLWRLVHDLEHTHTRIHPLSVLEIASRSGLSRGTVLLAITELLRHRRVRVSPPHTAPRTPLEEVRDGLSATHYSPALRSAKVLVLGIPEVLGRQFVGSCSHTRPLAVQEMVITTHDGAEDHAPGPKSLLISMGTLPMGSLHLCLLALPNPGVWDALWPSAARDACGTILIAHPEHLPKAARALRLLRRLESPVHVVLHHPDGTEPDPMTAAQALGADEVTLADVRSVPAARAALRDLLRQDPHRPHRVHLRPPPNAMPTNGRSEEGSR